MRFELPRREFEHPTVGHDMHGSGTLRGLATVLMVVSVVPFLSFALATFPASGTAAGGCHGHPEPMPAPNHSCCYAQPQATAPDQIVSSPTTQNRITGFIDTLEPVTAPLVIATPLQVDASPPLPSVLRI